jgi:hypothetical protein
MNIFHIAPKKEEASNNAASSTETTPVQTVQKPVSNTQQQVAIPKRKRRDRIPERPNYRSLFYHPLFLIKINLF